MRRSSILRRRLVLAMRSGMLWARQLVVQLAILAALLEQDDMTFWARLFVVQPAVQLAWDGVRSVRRCAWSALRRVLQTVLATTRFSLVELRVHRHGSHVSPLHSIICVLITVLLSLHIIHTRASLMHDVWRIRWETQKMGDVFLVFFGETKSMSTCTRIEVRCPAVEKRASPQQAPESLHDEMWAGILQKQGPKIFREMEIVPGCAVRVARPSCRDYSPEPPVPGRIIRNMLGWSLLEKTERSGVWVFRGALQGENLFFSPSRSRRPGKEGVVPHSVGGPLYFLMFLFICVWTWPRCRGTHWRAVLATAGRSVEGYRTPDATLVC